jgi:ABC-type transport system involved in Fe-S cluster assembly fused permease/ATPase subunit
MNLPEGYRAQVGERGMRLDAMRSLVKGRMAFVIAHRLSTLTHCDVPVAIENGYLNPLSCGLPTAVR